MFYYNKEQLSTLFETSFQIQSGALEYGAGLGLWSKCTLVYLNI